MMLDNKIADYEYAKQNGRANGRNFWNHRGSHFVGRTGSIGDAHYPKGKRRCLPRGAETMLRMCRTEGIHTYVKTRGMRDTEALKKLAEKTGLASIE